MTLFFESSNNFIRNNYKKITEEFCKYYYNLYDSNFEKISDLFISDILITYLGDELTGYSKYYTKIRQHGIYKFCHHKIFVTSQPVSNKFILININGTVTVNDSFIPNKFIETILLGRESNNKFFIYNLIFKLSE